MWFWGHRTARGIGDLCAEQRRRSVKLTTDLHFESRLMCGARFPLPYLHRDDAIKYAGGATLLYPTWKMSQIIHCLWRNKYWPHFIWGNSATRFLTQCISCEYWIRNRKEVGIVLFRLLTEDAENPREFSRCFNTWWRIIGETNSCGTAQPPVSKGTSHSEYDTLGIYTRRADTKGSWQSMVCHLSLNRKRGYRKWKISRPCTVLC